MATTNNPNASSQNERLEIERFSSTTLSFERSGDLTTHLMPLVNGDHQHGAVVISLNMDGEGVDGVTVADVDDTLVQLELAVQVLEKAIDKLATLEGLRPVVLDPARRQAFHDGLVQGRREGAR